MDWTASSRRTVIKALDDPSRDVRASAVRLAERFLAEPNPPVQAGPAQAHRRSRTGRFASNWRRRSASCRRVRAKRRWRRCSSGTATIRSSVDAALSGLRGGEAAVLASLLQSTADVAGARNRHHDAGGDARARRAGRRRADDPPAAWRTPDRPAWQRAAMLRGAEVALLGAAAPGSPAGRGGRGGGSAAGRGGDPTAPGGRAGPGGAPAFPREGGAVARLSMTDSAAAAAAADAAAGGGRGGGNPLRLTREPAALSALAAAGGELGPRATALLARIEWPGKPGAAAPVAAAHGRQRHSGSTRGRKLYESICLAVSPAGRPRQGGAGTESRRFGIRHRGRRRFRRAS